MSPASKLGRSEKTDRTIEIYLDPKKLQDWALYPPQFLIQLQNIFLGLVSTSSPEPEEDAAPVGRGRSASNEESDEDVDGVPLDGAALLKGRRETKESDEDSLDGKICGS